MMHDAAWLVLNQSQSPAFQALLSALSAKLGRCALYTGMPHEGAGEDLIVVQGPPYDRRSKVLRALSWARFMAGAALRVWRARREAVLVVTTNPPFLPHLVWLASRLRGHTYILIMWDLYPDHVVRMGWMSERSLLVRGWRRLNRLALGRANAVITLGEKMRRTILDQIGVEEDPRVLVIPNFTDTNAVRPLRKEDNPFAREHDQVGRVTIMYSGNLGATHGASAIAEVAEALRADHRVSFLVVGGGLGRLELEREAARRRLPNLRILNLQSWATLRYSLATAEIAIVSQAAGTEHLSVPSKAYSCLAAGSALLALTAPDSDLGRLVRMYDIGIVRPVGDVAGIVGAVNELLDDPQRLARLRSNARRVAEERFSVEAAEARFASVLNPAIAKACRRKEWPGE